MPAASVEMCLKLTSSLGSCQGCIAPTHPPSTPPSLSPCFIPSHIRASHSRTTASDTTTNTSHPCSSYPPLIFTLNLVLLSGLRLNTPSEISHFKKIHEQLEPPCCITAAITGSFADTGWRLKRLWDSKQNQVSWSSDKLSYWEGAFAKTLCDMMIGRQAQFPMNMDATVYASRRKKSSTYLTGKYF